MIRQTCANAPVGTTLTSISEATFANPGAAAAAAAAWAAVTCAAVTATAPAAVLAGVTTPGGAITVDAADNEGIVTTAGECGKKTECFLHSTRVADH